jgi:predicted DNA-binding protein (MmcQ/YjbR family)
MARGKKAVDSPVDRLRAFGLRYPGAHTKSPWPGHLDLAVKDKTFAYLSLAGEPLSISCKLPHSADAALALPFSTPTAYGLGKSGWVTASFPDDAGVPLELLEQWIDESYRAQAPKRLSAGLPPLGAGDATDIVPEPVRVASKSTVKHAAPKAAPARPRAAPRPARAARAATSARKKSNGRVSKKTTRKRRAASG